MLTSYLKSEVEMWSFRACEVKDVYYNPHLWTNRRNSRVLQEIGVYRKSIVTSDFRQDVEIWPFVHFGLGYEADTMFYRTHFSFGLISQLC